jgi:hypothetical protein
MAVVEDIFLDALGLVGIEAAAHAETAMLNRITSDFNKALQKVFALGPRIWSEKMAGTTIRAPESLTSLTYTDGTTVLSGASLAAHMHNCTIVIGSDGQQNRVVETGSGTYALAPPPLAMARPPCTTTPSISHPTPSRFFRPSSSWDTASSGH